MSIEASLERAFWTPIVIGTLPDHADIDAALEPLILERYGDRPAQGSRGGGWQSDSRLLDWGGGAARTVRDAAITLAERHTADLDAARAGHVRGWECFGWANICGHGGYNRPHTHADSYWAAVYYVRVDPGDGGELVIHDPRMPGIEMHAPRLRLHPSGGEGAINIAPEAGMLLLMPGWLEHSVAPYFGDGHRISIAMNLAARFGAGVVHDPAVIRMTPPRQD